MGRKAIARILPVTQRPNPTRWIAGVFILFSAAFIIACLLT